MNSSVPVLVLPNPETPLAFLPPNIAGQLEASDYLYVATLGVRKLSIYILYLFIDPSGLDMGSSHVPWRRVPRTLQVSFLITSICLYRRSVRTLFP